MLSGCAFSALPAQSESLVAAYVPLDSARGVNKYPISEYGSYNGRVFKAWLSAVQSNIYTGDYADCAVTHLAVQLSDWTGDTPLMAYIDRLSPDGEALAALLADGETHKVILRLKLPLAQEEPGSLPTETEPEPPEPEPAPEPPAAVSEPADPSPADSDALESATDSGPVEFPVGEPTDLHATPTAAFSDGLPHVKSMTAVRRAPVARGLSVELTEPEVPIAVGTAAARIVSLVAVGWSDPEANSAALFEAVETAAPTDVLAMLRAGADPKATDSNGDGLLYAALRRGDLEMATVLVASGVPTANHNYYHSGFDYMTDAEIADAEATALSINASGSSAGCANESLLGCFVASGRVEQVAFLLSLNSFNPNDAALSQTYSRQLAEAYGVALPEGACANVLDIAVIGGETGIAERLMNGGLFPSPLLLAKIAQKMDFSQSMIELFGERRFFGLLDDVLADFQHFHASYEKIEADLLTYAEKIDEYDALYAAGRIFDANYLFSNEITPAAERQTAAVAGLTEPKSVEIQALYQQILDYVAACGSAARQLRLVNESMTKQARQRHFAQYDHYQKRADALCVEIQDTVEYYLALSKML